jgi:hypothetical protein
MNLKIVIVSYTPMRQKKSEQFGDQQMEIAEKIAEILDLKNVQSYTLDELDQNIDIQTRIEELIPEIHKWFACNNFKAIRKPDSVKRKWLSIIKQVVPMKYDIEKVFIRYKVDKKWFSTPKYIFSPINDDI